jgi:hypothetical protein
MRIKLKDLTEYDFEEEYQEDQDDIEYALIQKNLKEQQRTEEKAIKAIRRRLFWAKVRRYIINLFKKD